MQYYYGSQNILRALDEAEFWKHQEAEHADLIPLVTPHLESEYKQPLEQFATDFRLTHAEAVKYITSINRSKGMINRELKTQMQGLIRRGVMQSQNFINLMTMMLNNSHAIRVNQPSQGLIHHMIRESSYFIGIDQLML